MPAKPMSVESTRASVVSTTRNGAKSDTSCAAASKIKPENVKNVRTSEEARCERVVGEQDVNTTGTVTAAHVGHRVCVSGTKVGILRYYGEINLARGLFCGVELDEPAGLNDGSVQGVRYFTCRPQHGIIAPVGIVRPLPQQFPDIGLKTSADVSLDESGPFSLLDDITMEQMEDHLQTQQSATSTPTPSSVTSNAVLWESWGRQHSFSSTSLVSSHSQYQSQSSQQLSKHNSLELDESVGIAMSEQSSPVGSQPRHQLQYQSQLSHQLSKQSSFELDESLGILTPDQMTDFTVCVDKATIGRAPSFDDMGVFLLGDLKSDNVEDFLPDRLPSESDGLSSSNYPSSEFPQLPDDALDSIFQVTEKVDSVEHFVISQVENVSVQELELLSNDLMIPNQQQISPKTVFCASDDLSDNICPVVSKSSDGDFRVGQDISDRTLSPEDLPMDTPFQEVMGESLQKVEITSESGRDTAGPSGATSTGTPSRSSAAPLAPSSFVTSVTSITSLDNGYQGDGEWSRPGSRGADHSPTNHRVVKLKTPVADPMTDSDFFTESDADTHDDLGAGSGRGDRRAQVIDGTLYGTNLHAGGTVLLGQQHQRCPSFTASINEEMESSGVYSDLERRPEDAASDGKEVHIEDQVPAEGNFSPDGSIKTISSRSELSQIKEQSLAFTAIIQKTVSDSIGELPTCGVDANDLLTGNNTKNQQDLMILIPAPVAVESIDVSLDRLTHNTEVPLLAAASTKAPSPTSSSILNTSTCNNSSKGDNHHQSKKYKVPKKNVHSKVKAMIESSSSAISGKQNTEDENQENRRPTCSPSKSLRKNVGRWDAVMNKIAQGQAEQKMKPRNLKEVKSKVFANITLSASEGASRRTRKTNSSSLGPSVSLRTLKENSPLKAKSCRSRTSQQQEAPGHGTTSPNSSLHSSISDVSVSQSHALGKASTKSSSSLRSLKKRDAGRSASPLSDGSTSHVTSRSSRQPLQKNGSSVTAVVDMKTPAARKQASRRITANSGQKPTPLRDHNRQEQADGGLFKSGGEAPPSSKPGEVSVTPQKPAPQPQPTPVEILLPQLQHNSSGFEALGVLVQYLVYSLDAFSTPRLQKDLENMKTDWLKCKLKLEEAEVSYQRMEENLKQENVLCHQKIEELENAKRCELAARDTKHSCEIAELVARHEAELCDFEKRLKEQLEEMKGRYEAELSRADQKHAEKLESVTADGKAHLGKVQHEHASLVARLEADTFQTETELRHRLATVEEEYSALKVQSRKLMESMQKDKDTKLQVTAGRCKELQDEVESLQTVLDLRHEELQELRKQNAFLTREAEELPVALQRVAALEAKVEDLQVQLKVKTSIERQLSQDNRLLMESFHQESKQSKRLSLHNEELQWKLKQNFEVVLAALSGSSVSSSVTSSLQTPPTNGQRSVHSSAQSLTDTDTSAAGNQHFTSRIPSCSSPAGRSYNSSGSDLSADPAAGGRSVLAEDIEISPPASPKVKAVVEKSDSVSWVLEMDETPEALLSRLVRRAGSFRGTVPPLASVPSPARAKTLPPPKRQRHKASSLCLSSSATAIAKPVAGSQSRNVPLTSSLRFRSRSISTDSVEDMGLDCGSWNAKTSTPLHSSYRHGGCEDGSCLKHCRADVYGNDDSQNVSSVIHNLSGVSNGTTKRETSDYCNEEDSPSKSSGSCGSSDGSHQDHDHLCFQSRKKISGNLTDSSAVADSLDLGDPEILNLPPLPGSTNGDLSFLAAQSLPAPKESAGEAMISEETSEDENDNADEINTSSDEHSCSEDEETSSSSGSSSDLRPVTSRGLTVHETGEIERGYGSQKQEEEEGVGRVTEVTAGQQNVSAVGDVHQCQVLMSESAAATTMDLSWSENVKLMPSESDG